MLQTSNTAKAFVQSKIEEISSEILKLEQQKEAVEAKLKKDASSLPLMTSRSNYWLMNFKMPTMAIWSENVVSLPTGCRWWSNLLPLLWRLAKDAERLVLSQFGPSEALFDFFETGARSDEVSSGMSFSVVLLDGIMRRVTVSRREPLKVIQLIAVDKHGLITETEQTHENLSEWNTWR